MIRSLSLRVWAGLAVGVVAVSVAATSASASSGPGPDTLVLLWTRHWGPQY
jgi:hypothetical protein